MQVLTLVLSSAFYLLPANILNTAEFGDVKPNTQSYLSQESKYHLVQQTSPRVGLKKLNHQPKLNAMNE